MRFARHTVCVGALLTIAACKSDKKSEDVLAQDSTLNRDLTLANQDTAVRPQLKDVPVAIAPVAPTPPPAPPRPVVKPQHRPPPKDRVVAPPPPSSPPPPPVTTPSGNTVASAPSGPNNSEGRIGTVPAGATLTMAAGQQVCTNTNKVGDRFTATLSEDVTASHGIVLPAGATVELEVTSLQPSQKAGDNVVIGIVARSVSYGGKTSPLNGEITSAQTEQVKSANNNDAKKVGTGAAIGAVLGNIFGGGSRVVRTIVGAAGGAAAGAVVAHETAKYDGCIPSGGSITVRLDQAMQIQAVAVGSN